MTGSGPDAADPGSIWPFALRVYDDEAVRQACLDMQETFGVNVPGLLFAAWAGRCGIRLDAAGFAQVAAGVAPWHDEVVVALRRVRVRLKSGPAPAPDEASGKVRDIVKRAELEAERVELSEWARAGAGLPREAAAEAAVGGNLDVALAHYEAAGPGAEAAREAIRRAAG